MTHPFEKIISSENQKENTGSQSRRELLEKAMMALPLLAFAGCRTSGSSETKADVVTTAVGEGGGGTAVTTAVGEGGDGTAVTTAVGEGGDGTVVTTAVEENGGGTAVTTAVGEDGGGTVVTTAVEENGGGSAVTTAVGEGGGGTAVTTAVEENGGQVLTTARAENGGSGYVRTTSMGTVKFAVSAVTTAVGEGGSGTIWTFHSLRTGKTYSVDNVNLPLNSTGQVRILTDGATQYFVTGFVNKSTNRIVLLSAASINE